MIEWTVEDYRVFPSLLDEYRAAENGEEYDHPLLLPEFIIPCLEHFPETSLAVLVGRVAEVICVLALVSRAGKPLAWQTFAPSQLPIAPVYINRRLVEPTSVQDIFGALKNKAIVFNVLHHDRLYQAAIEGYAEAIEYCETMAIDCASDFDAYWAQRSKKLRDNIKRYTRRAERNNYAIELREVREPELISQALKTYCDIESRGWKGREGTAIVWGGDQGNFYLDLLNRFAAHGRARIFHLMFNDQVVAARIAVENDGILVFLKTTYDEDYSEYAAGRLMLYAAAKAQFQDSIVRRMEFYTKSNPDQAQWATTQRPIVHLTYYRSSAVRSIVNLIRWARGRLG